MTSAGEAQETRAREYLRRLGYSDVTVGENNIKNLLNIKASSGANPNCADIVGFMPSLKNAFSVIVFESKGTDVHALVQLGNVAGLCRIMNRQFGKPVRHLQQLFGLVPRP